MIQRVVALLGGTNTSQKSLSVNLRTCSTTSLQNSPLQRTLEDITVVQHGVKHNTTTISIPDSPKRPGVDCPNTPNNQIETFEVSRTSETSARDTDSNPLPRMRVDVFDHKSVISIMVLDIDPRSICAIESMFHSDMYHIIFNENFLDMSIDQIVAYVTDVQTSPGILLIDVAFNNSADIIKQIRIRLSREDLPIIVSACSRFEHDVFKCLELGANDFVYKPLRFHEMQYRINNLMQISQYVKKRSILLDILPVDIITNLEHGISFIAKYHADVTILFSDICSYTVMSSRLPTKQIIHLLNTMFCGFDDICLKNHVYKVETIGDAYMIASGHDGVKDHVNRMVRVAREMLQFVNADPILAGIQVRIGIHTGSAHSGVIGKIRPRYCFFGDTVNTASRMESHGIPDAIHFSVATYAQLTDTTGVSVQDRGIIIVKGKGDIHTYIARPI